VDNNGHHGFYNCEGSTPEVLSLSIDRLPLVLPTARGRTFPAMGDGRTHLFDGDLKDCYFESNFLLECGQIAIPTNCILYEQKVDKFMAIIFSRTQSCASRKIACKVF